MGNSDSKAKYFCSSDDAVTDVAFNKFKVLESTMDKIQYTASHLVETFQNVEGKSDKFHSAVIQFYQGSSSKFAGLKADTDLKSKREFYLNTTSVVSDLLDFQRCLQAARIQINKLRSMEEGRRQWDKNTKNLRTKYNRSAEKEKQCKIDKLRKALADSERKLARLHDLELEQRTSVLHTLSNIENEQYSIIQPIFFRFAALQAQIYKTKIQSLETLEKTA